MEQHGDEDYQEQDTAHLEDALEQVVETIMDCGQYPARKSRGEQPRMEFDLYEFLLENRDPSYFLEMYLATFSSDNLNLEERIMRERKTVEALLRKHLTGSDMVQELADEMASWDKDE